MSVRTQINIYSPHKVQEYSPLSFMVLLIFPELRHFLSRDKIPADCAKYRWIFIVESNITQTIHANGRIHTQKWFPMIMRNRSSSWLFLSFKRNILKRPFATAALLLHYVGTFFDYFKNTISIFHRSFQVLIFVRSIRRQAISILLCILFLAVLLMYMV